MYSVCPRIKKKKTLHAAYNIILKTLAKNIMNIQILSQEFYPSSHHSCDGRTLPKNALMLVFLLGYLQSIGGRTERKKNKKILGLLCFSPPFYFWMVYNDSRVLPFAFFLSLFLFCPAVPSFEDGRGWSIRVKEMKNVIRIHHFHSFGLSSPLLKIQLIVLRKPEVCWEYYITNLKTFRKEALYSS